MTSLDYLLAFYENKATVQSGYETGLEYGKKAQYCFQHIHYDEPVEEYMNFDGFVFGFNEGFSYKNVEMNKDYNEGFYRGNIESGGMYYSTMRMKNEIYSNGYQDGWDVGDHFRKLMIGEIQLE